MRSSLVRGERGYAMNLWRGPWRERRDLRATMDTSGFRRAVYVSWAAEAVRRFGFTVEQGERLAFWRYRSRQRGERATRPREDQDAETARRIVTPEGREGQGDG
jgi:hypothetical protein